MTHMYRCKRCGTTVGCHGENIFRCELRLCDNCYQSVIRPSKIAHFIRWITSGWKWKKL